MLEQAPMAAVSGTADTVGHPALQTEARKPFVPPRLDEIGHLNTLTQQLGGSTLADPPGGVDW